MSLVRTALFEGQISPPSLSSYNLREIKNIWDSTFPSGGRENAISGSGGVTYNAVIGTATISATSLRAYHNSLAFTLKEIYGADFDPNGKYTFLFQLRCTGFIKRGYYLFLFQLVHSMNEYIVIQAPAIPEDKEYVSCMVQWDFSSSNRTIKVTVDGKQVFNNSFNDQISGDTLFRFLHPLSSVTNPLVGKARPIYAYQLSARDFVFIKDDDVGISGVQSNFAGLTRYEFRDVEIGDGMALSGGLPENELSKPITDTSSPVLTTNPMKPGGDFSFKINTANTLPRSIRVDGIGVQITVGISELELSDVTIKCVVKDDVSDIAEFYHTVPKPAQTVREMHYQVPLGFIDLLKEGIKIKPSQAANIRFEFTIMNNTNAFEIYQVIAYVFGNDYISGFYDDTSLFGTLSSRYTNLRLVEDNHTDFDLSLPRPNVLDVDRNTEIDVIAKPNSQWSGQTTLRYDRLDMSVFVDDSFASIPELVTGVQAHSILPQISQFLGLKVIDNDIDNTTFMGGELIVRAASTSRSFIPGTQFVLKTQQRDMEHMFTDELLPGFRDVRDESKLTHMLVHVNDGQHGPFLSDVRGGIVTPSNIRLSAEGAWVPTASAVIHGEDHPSFIDITPIDPMDTVGHGQWFEMWLCAYGSDTRFEGTLIHTPQNNQIRLGDNARAFYSGYATNYLSATYSNPWPTLTKGKWYHVRIVIEDQYWAIYIDGKRICYTANPFAKDFIGKSQTTYRIGNVFPTGNAIGGQLRASIDEFRIIEQPSNRLSTYNVPTGPYSI